MIFIVSNGKAYSAHRLYFVWSDPNHDFRAWLEDVKVYDGPGYKCFDWFGIVGIIDGELHIEGESAQISTMSEEIFHKVLCDEVWPEAELPRPDDGKYRL